MPDYLRDETDLPTAKQDVRTRTSRASQTLEASEWNTVMAAIDSLRTGIYENAVDVRNNFGTVDPTGVADSTDAIIAALEEANGIADWEDGDGDDYETYATRQRRVVVIPPGIYKLTRSIPIKYRGVGIVGIESCGPTEPSEGRKVILYGDHNDSVIEVLADYNVNGFYMQNLQIKKRNAYIGNGHGVEVHGENYVFGMHFDRVGIQWCEDGFHMVCQDLSDGTGSMADLVFRNSALANNSGYGLSIRGHVAIGGLYNNSIVANGTGGVLMGCKGFEISGNDFEGQEKPVQITNGSASTCCNIHNNYFEANTAATTVADINLYLNSNFSIFNNQFSATAQVAPLIGIHSCGDGVVDQLAHVTGSVNIGAKQGMVFPTAGTGVNELSFVYNQSWGTTPRGRAGAFTGLAQDGAGTAHFKVDDRLIPADIAVAPNYRILTGMFASVASNEYLFFGGAINYPTDVPDTILCQLLGDIGAGATVLKAWNMYVSFTTPLVGDTLTFIVGIKNAFGATITNPRLYVYPFGGAAGVGARVSQIAYWRSSSPILPNVNPLDLVSGIGSGAPTSGTWAVGDRVYITPTSPGFIGKVCTVAGTPGTWVDFGAIP